VPGAVTILEKIISGGQTGADQGALDAAIDCNLPHGGSIPAGRLTEAGPLPERYQLVELSTDSYPARTAQNVKDADATLIISRGTLSGGSALTRDLAVRYGRPWMHVDLQQQDEVSAIAAVSGWLKNRQVKTLNVAGPRASSDPRIYQATYRLVAGLLQLDIERDREGG
jgi:hypothetical protein